MLISFVVLGKYLEAVAKARTSASLTSLMSIKVKQATLIRPKKLSSKERKRRRKAKKKAKKHQIALGQGSLPSLIDAVGSEEDVEEVEIDPKLLQKGDIVKVCIVHHALPHAIYLLDDLLLLLL